MPPKPLRALPPADPHAPGRSPSPAEPAPPALVHPPRPTPASLPLFTLPGPRADLSRVAPSSRRRLLPSPCPRPAPSPSVSRHPAPAPGRRPYRKAAVLEGGRTGRVAPARSNRDRPAGREERTVHCRGRGSKARNRPRALRGPGAPAPWCFRPPGHRAPGRRLSTSAPRTRPAARRPLAWRWRWCWASNRATSHREGRAPSRTAPGCHGIR